MKHISSIENIPGLLVIELCSQQDERGVFMEVYKESEFFKAGIQDRFIQDNYSSSSYGVLRGLHFQREPHGQAKLIRVTRGIAWSVAIDLRKGSQTRGAWHGLHLSETNNLLFYIPPGFAHGFLALADNTELSYKASSEYERSSEAGIRWDDPDLAISWPMCDVVVSAKDAALPWLKDLS